MSNLSLLVPVLLLAAFVNNGEAVRCWTCSSDLNPICADPFYPGRPETAYLYRLDNCDGNSASTYPLISESKTTCKKQKKYIGGQLVVIRGCAWKRADDYSNACPTTSNAYNDVTSFCETCDYDGCNGASTIATTIALLIAPIGLLLFK